MIKLNTWFNMLILTLFLLVLGQACTTIKYSDDEGRSLKYQSWKDYKNIVIDRDKEGKLYIQAEGVTSGKAESIKATTELFKEINKDAVP